jgi:hypothetical protein
LHVDSLPRGFGRRCQEYRIPQETSNAVGSRPSLPSRWRGRLAWVSFLDARQDVGLKLTWGSDWVRSRPAFTQAHPSPLTEVWYRQLRTRPRQGIPNGLRTLRRQRVFHPTSLLSPITNLPLTPHQCMRRPNPLLRPLIHRVHHRTLLHHLPLRFPPRPPPLRVQRNHRVRSPVHLRPNRQGLRQGRRASNGRRYRG